MLTIEKNFSRVLPNPIGCATILSENDGSRFAIGVLSKEIQYRFPTSLGGFANATMAYKIA